MCETIFKCIQRLVFDDNIKKEINSIYADIDAFEFILSLVMWYELLSKVKNSEFQDLKHVIKQLKIYQMSLKSKKDLKNVRRNS